MISVIYHFFVKVTSTEYVIYYFHKVANFPNTALDYVINSVNPHTVNTRPSLRDLQQCFTPQYAVQWRVIGTQLGLPTATLDIIEHDNHYKAMQCCDTMLSKWLEVDTTASWEQLFAVIESTAVSCSKGD